jgi:hypothetical protein
MQTAYILEKDVFLSTELIVYGNRKNGSDSAVELDAH